MAYEYLIGLNVTDESLYGAYRAAMTPILTAHGGSFGCDFSASAMLKGPPGALINRVFTIRFPSEEAAGLFFADASYRAAKEKFFTPSVSEVHVLAEYETPAA